MAQQQSPAPLASELMNEMSTWFYKAPERNSKGGYSTYIVRKEGDFNRIYFQATSRDEQRCTAPFGVSEPYDETKQDDPKRNLELNVNTKSLSDFLRALDEVTLKNVIKNYDSWFNPEKKKKSLTAEEIKSMYRPLMTEPKDPKYAPTFRTKVVIKGQNPVRVFVLKTDRNGQQVCVRGKLGDITPFSEVVPIVEIFGIWFMSKEYGVSLTTTDIVVYPKASRPPGLFNFGGEVPMIVDSVDDRDPEDDGIVPSDEVSRVQVQKTE